nr:putative ribonuclease H-like domain-containing protein [Tanacetum cinerariifolium]
MTLIEAARTMLADSLLPIPFWAEAFNTACYVQNRVLVTKPHNKTPYELLHGRTPSTGLTWFFDIDSLTKTMNYQPVHAGNQTISGAEDDAFDEKEHDFDVKKLESKVILSPSSSAQSKEQDDKTMKEAKRKSPVESVIGYKDLNTEFQDCSKNSSNEVKQKMDGIFISQDKYVAEIIRKFRLTEGKSSSTPIDTEKPLLKDPDGKDVDVHTYSKPKSFTPLCSKADL